MAASAVPSNARNLHLTATTSEASTEQARHIIKVRPVATAAEHGLHTLLSTAPQGASHLSAEKPTRGEEAGVACHRGARQLQLPLSTCFSLRCHSTAWRVALVSCTLTLLVQEAQPNRVWKRKACRTWWRKRPNGVACHRGARHTQLPLATLCRLDGSYLRPATRARFEVSRKCMSLKGTHTHPLLNTRRTLLCLQHYRAPCISQGSEQVGVASC